jgi:hypothetical protein
MRIHTAAAIFAATARGDAGDEHAVARMEHRHAGPNLLDRSGFLVTEDASRGGVWDVAFENMEIRAAVRRLGDPHDRVIGYCDLGDRPILQRLPARTLIDQRLPAILLNGMSNAMSDGEGGAAIAGLLDELPPRRCPRRPALHESGENLPDYALDITKTKMVKKSGQAGVRAGGCSSRSLAFRGGHPLHSLDAAPESISDVGTIPVQEDTPGRPKKCVLERPYSVQGMGFRWQITFKSGDGRMHRLDEQVSNAEGYRLCVFGE